MTKKKRKRRKSALKSEGEGPNEHNGKPPETPFQRSMCLIAAPHIDPTIPIDQTIPVDPSLIHPATPIDPELKTTKKTRKKNRNNVLKSEGTELNKHDAGPTVETSVLRTKGLTITAVPLNWPDESSMRKRNAKPPAKTRVQRTAGLTVAEVPFKWHGKSPMTCRSCQQSGHRSRDCPNVKCVSLDDEICFFCGEVGHSLGKCSVFTAGGGRFAKCLFCYAQGHFSKYCPQKCFGFYPKVFAATGPINLTYETEGMPVVEVTNM